MILQLNPPIPLTVLHDDGSQTEALAHFLQDMGIESEDFWVVFLPGGIRWVPNSKVRPCTNWSIGRQMPETKTMAKTLYGETI